MHVPLPLLAVAAIVFAALLFFAFRRDSSRDLMAPPRFVPPPTMPEADLPDDVLDEARALVAQGNKIEAIKRVRAARRMSLGEAKALVERL